MADSEESSVARVDSCDEETVTAGQISTAHNGELEEAAAKHPPAAGAAGNRKKKKKKKSKKESESDVTDHGTAVSPTGGMSAGAALQNIRQLQNLQKTFELLRVNDGKPAKTKEEAMRKKFQFWETQPVPKLGKETVRWDRILFNSCTYFYRKGCFWYGNSYRFELSRKLMTLSGRCRSISIMRTPLISHPLQFVGLSEFMEVQAFSHNY